MTAEQRAVFRDSIGALRAATVKQCMAKIAGHENEPAGDVFNNVQIWKDMPAGQFLTAMDQNVGRALSRNCTSCHVADQWESDDKEGKKRARIMMQMTNAINNEQLTKMPPNRNGQTPRIGCVTCHRGNGNPGMALLP